MMIRRCITALLLCALQLPLSAIAATPVDDLELDLLPVTAVNPADKDKPMVVFFSGDGGWAELDSAVSANLAKQGMPVVGWSSLTYFWSFKNPGANGQRFSADPGLLLERVATFAGHFNWLFIRGGNIPVCYHPTATGIPQDDCWRGHAGAVDQFQL
jgi:Type IV secretory pathway, VirJ component